MARFRVNVRDPATGDAHSVVVEADSEDAAREFAESPGNVDFSQAVTAEAQGPKDQPAGAANQFMSGANTVALGALGLPGSALNKAAQFATGEDVSPFVGSGELIERATARGQISGTPQTQGEQVARLAGENLTAGALAAPAVPASRAALIARPGRFGASELTASGAAAVGGTFGGEPGSTGELLGQIGGVALPIIAAPTGAALMRGAFRGGANGQAHAADVIERFGALGANPTAGMVGNKWLMGVESLLESVPGSSGPSAPLHRSAKAMQEKIGEATQRVVRNTSDVSTPTAAGQVIKGGLVDFVERFRRDAGVFYSRLDTHIPPGTRTSVDNTLTKLDEILAPIPGAPGVSESLDELAKTSTLRKLMERLLEDASDGTVPYEAVAGIRSRIGDLLTDTSMISDIPRGKLKQVYAALSDDMKALARAQGPAAERAFFQANQLYSKGIQHIDDFVDPLLKKVDFDQVFNQVVNSPTRAMAVRRSVTPEEWAAVTASVIRRLGKATPGKQGAPGADMVDEVFSTETFLTNYNKLSAASRAVLFDGGRFNSKDGLDLIAGVAADIRDKGGVFPNPSGTAGRGLNAAVLYSVLTSTTGGVLGAAAGGPGGAAFGSAAGLATGALSANMMSRLMTNSKFSNWLAETTKLADHRIPAHLGRLANLSFDPATQEAVSAFLQDVRVKAALQEKAHVERQPKQPEPTPGNVAQRIRGIAGQ